MLEVPTITWKELPGNKYSRSLHPAMFTKGKYHKYMEFAPTGATRKKMFIVEYDQEYALKWLARKVHKPLEPLGKEQVIQLIEKAYEYNE